MDLNKPEFHLQDPGVDLPLFLSLFFGSDNSFNFELYYREVSIIFN